jgi:hypothetical protein
MSYERQLTGAMGKFFGLLARGYSDEQAIAELKIREQTFGRWLTCPRFVHRHDDIIRKRQFLQDSEPRRIAVASTIAPALAPTLARTLAPGLPRQPQHPPQTPDRTNDESEKLDAELDRLHARDRALILLPPQERAG